MCGSPAKIVRKTDKATRKNVLNARQITGFALFPSCLRGRQRGYEEKETEEINLKMKEIKEKEGATINQFSLRL